MSSKLTIHKLLKTQTTMKKIATKDTDSILDWMIDNRGSAKAIVFAGRDENNVTTGAVLGESADVEKIFYAILKNSPSTANLMLAALDRFTKNEENIKAYHKLKEEL